MCDHFCVAYKSTVLQTRYQHLDLVSAGVAVISLPVTGQQSGLGWGVHLCWLWQISSTEKETTS